MEIFDSFQALKMADERDKERKIIKGTNTQLKGTE